MIGLSPLGLTWDLVDLEKGALVVRKQFTHGAWADLKTANSRRRVPLAKELVKQLRLHRLRTPGELVFPSASGAPLDYHNWRARVWEPLLKRTGQPPRSQSALRSTAPSICCGTSS